MDINFHYFAVKSLAVKAGFSADESQLIASYSQFVDDYNRAGTVMLDNVPEFARHLAKKEGRGWCFHCVTTGFSSWFDFAKLLSRDNQRNIAIPFHFIPPQPLNAKIPEGSPDWRVAPETFEKPTVLRDLMLYAKERYRNAPAARENLILIGLLLHVFADTYAHQKFSGFGGWWNHGVVTSSYDNLEQSHAPRVTAEANGEPAALDGGLPSPFVGHATFGHSPDETFLCFTARQKKRDHTLFDLKYTRDNTAEFLLCARRLLNFLRDCRGLKALSQSEWEPIGAAVRRGFLTREKEPKKLVIHWRKSFPDIDYDYRVGALLSQSLSQPHPSSLARFANSNAAVDLVERAVNGEKALADIFSDGDPSLVEQEDEISTLPREMAQLNAANDSLPSMLTRQTLTVHGEDFFWFNVFAKRVRDAVKQGFNK